MAKVRDIDRGFKQIYRQLYALKGSSVKVGIQEGELTKAEVKQFRVKPAGESMAQIAYTNEFGAGHIPARPFIRPAIDENTDKIYKLMNNQINLILQLKQTAQGALRTTGVYGVGLIRTKILSITSPPNAPYTIAVKGSSKPLIDFGQMLNSVAYMVEMRK